MNNVTPEHLVTVTQGATPVQIVILILLGLIALGVVIAIVKWIIDTRLGTLPQELKEIQRSLETLKSDMIKLDSKLWSEKDITRVTKEAMVEHIEHFHK